MLIPNDYFSINIRKSETARRDICRGLSLAENPFRLLMIAIGCIADMSGDNTFFSSCQQSLEKIYGAGLEDSRYLEHRVSELKQSIDKLERCLDTCNENVRERLQFALRLQRNELESLLKKVLVEQCLPRPVSKNVPYRETEARDRQILHTRQF